jgi:hypothetical protein
MHFVERLRATERQALRGILDRITRRAQRRIDKGRADRLANPAAPVDLTKPVENEDAP